MLLLLRDVRFWVLAVPVAWPLEVRHPVEMPCVVRQEVVRAWGWQSLGAVCR